jgi:glycosyltransferase involved in cell wall biosynthesis
MADDCRYIIISPVKDEGRYISKTLHSVAAQTLKPALWVIVDDGSCDGTAERAIQFAEAHPWIRVHRLGRDRPRQPGSAVINAFNAGVALAGKLDFDFIVKLDGDLDLPASYFEKLLAKFREDPTLGIASGQYVEDHDGRRCEIKMPDYHAAGASKVVRAECFRAIGGFVASRGWDTVDEIRAHAHGWKTAHFAEIQFDHLKPEGSGIGSLRTNFMHGEIHYLTGAGGLFFGLKVAHRAWSGRPRVTGAVAMLMGFFAGWMRKRPRLVSDLEARHYKAILNRRILGAFAWLRPSTRLEAARDR